MKLIFDTPFITWLLPLCLAGALAFAFLFYRNSVFYKEKGLFSYPLLLLIFLRFLSISLILVLILGVMIKRDTERIEKPVVLLASDNSRSILLSKDSVFYKNEFKDNYEKFIGSISKKFNVDQVLFGKNVTIGNKPDYSENRTNIAGLLEYIKQHYYNRNLGAVVIASDGLTNEGRDPMQMLGDLRIPVYTIALGDTSIYKDLLIKELINNSIAYAGSSIPVRIRVQALKCAGQKWQLSIIHKNKQVWSQLITSEGDLFEKTIDAQVNIEETGIQLFKVVLSRLNGEINTKNNSRTFVVDVLENKKKVLLIAASPHPDVSAIKNSLVLHDNYQTKTITAAELPRNKTEIENLISGCDVVILHQLPAKNYPVRELMNAINVKQLPLFMILGSQTSIPQFNSLELGLKIIQKKEMVNSVMPLLVNSFNYFNVPENSFEIFPELPPVTAPFGEYRLNQEAQVLLKQKIGQVTSDVPLFVFINGISSRAAIFCGEGMWKWPLIEYKLKGNQEVFDGMMHKSIQYLSVKTDKRFFRVKAAQSQFYEDEQVQFYGEVLNNSYEMLKGAKIKMLVTDEAKNKKEFMFLENSDGYNLNMGYLPPGSYFYQASTIINNKEIKLTGEFNIAEAIMEYTNTVADHKLLYRMSKSNEGKMFYPNQLKELLNEINSDKNIRPMSFFESTIRDLIDIKWIFFVLTLLLCIEWFLRKFYGSY